MRYLYTLCIYGLGLIIYCLKRLGHKKSTLWINERQHHPYIQEKKPNQKLVWFHFSSAGEYEQGMPVFNAFKSTYPEHQFLISFFSPSGFKHKKKLHDHDLVVYLPLDTLKNAKTFINHYQPEICVLNKYDFWFNMMIEAQKKQCRIILINAIFRPQQYYFSILGSWPLSIIKKCALIFTQDSQTQELLAKHTITQTFVVGDTRFNRAEENKKIAHPIVEQLKSKLPKDKTIIVAGSTWEKDEQNLIDFIKENSLGENIQLIIAPHEELSIPFTEDMIKLSDSNALTTIDKTIIVDEFGVLKYLYALADICYLGGGFNKGIHNVLEAAVYGKPIIFGPKYSKFKEAKDLINEKGAINIHNKESFNNALESLLVSTEFRNELGIHASKYTNKQLEATMKIMRTMNITRLLR